MTKRQLPDLEAASFIAKHSLALLVPDHSWPGGVRPVGSGSLVTVDGRHFILTATHVWIALRKSSIIGYSATAGISQSINLHRDSLTPYSLDDGVKEEPEPFDADLTLLELHPIDSQKMDARHSFFQLEREEHGPGADCVIVGAPGVLAKPDSTEANTLSFELRAIFVKTLTNEPERDGINFLRSLPYQDPHSPIRDYRGLSGGGLWSVHYYPEKSADERFEIFLIGVNFYQDDKEVRGLGRKAIKKLVQKMRDSTSVRRGPA
jgi:hypothetical protein